MTRSGRAQLRTPRIRSTRPEVRNSKLCVVGYKKGWICSTASMLPGCAYAEPRPGGDGDERGGTSPLCPKNQFLPSLFHAGKAERKILIGLFHLGTYNINIPRHSDNQHPAIVTDNYTKNLPTAKWRTHRRAISRWTRKWYIGGIPSSRRLNSSNTRARWIPTTPTMQARATRPTLPVFHPRSTTMYSRTVHTYSRVSNLLLHANADFELGRSPVSCILWNGQEFTTHRRGMKVLLRRCGLTPADHHWA
jgi:hypothetical protein